MNNEQKVKKEKKLEDEIREAAKGYSFSKFLAETINERLKAGYKIKIKSELKDIFLRSGCSEETAECFSKLTFLYYSSIGLIAEIPIKKEKTKQAKEIINKFIEETVEHELPAMLVVRLLFGVLEGFADRFFIVAEKLESDKDDIEVS